MSGSGVTAHDDLMDLACARGEGPAVRKVGRSRPVRSRQGGGPSTGRRSPSRRLCLGMAVVLMTASMGACVRDDVDQGVAGTMNGPAAEDIGLALVTAAERDAIGYEVPGGSLNSDLLALATAHRQEIYAEVEPAVEEALGRDVQMGSIVASYPYSSIDVTYRTVDEPVVSSEAFVSLRSDGSVGRIEVIDDDTARRLTVRGLFMMAYRDRVEEPRSHLLETYPLLTALPDGYARFIGEIDPMVTIGIYPRLHGEELQVLEDEQREIYSAYLDEPERSDEAWRALLEEVYGDRDLTLGLDLMLVDPDADVSEELVRQVAEDVRSSAELEGCSHWTVTIYSNRMLRDVNGARIFHEQISISAEDGSAWYLDYLLNGYSAWSGLDGEERTYASGFTPGSEDDA
jgi:hypothetical protein